MQCSAAVRLWSELYGAEQQPRCLHAVARAPLPSSRDHHRQDALRNECRFRSTSPSCQRCPLRWRCPFMYFLVWGAVAPRPAPGAAAASLCSMQCPASCSASTRSLSTCHCMHRMRSVCFFTYGRTPPQHAIRANPHTHRSALQVRGCSVSVGAIIMAEQVQGQGSAPTGPVPGMHHVHVPVPGQPGRFVHIAVPPHLAGVPLRVTFNNGSVTVQAMQAAPPGAAGPQAAAGPTAPPAPAPPPPDPLPTAGVQLLSGDAENDIAWQDVRVSATGVKDDITFEVQWRDGTFDSAPAAAAAAGKAAGGGSKKKKKKGKKTAAEASDADVWDRVVAVDPGAWQRAGAGSAAAAAAASGVLDSGVEAGAGLADAGLADANLADTGLADASPADASPANSTHCSTKADAASTVAADAAGATSPADATNAAGAAGAERWFTDVRLQPLEPGQTFVLRVIGTPAPRRR